MTEKTPRGFANLTPEHRQRIARMGQAALAASGKRYQFNVEKAREAGRLGGLKRAANVRAKASPELG